MKKYYGSDEFMYKKLNDEGYDPNEEPYYEVYYHYGQHDEEYISLSNWQLVRELIHDCRSSEYGTVAEVFAMYGRMY